MKVVLNAAQRQSQAMHANGPPCPAGHSRDELSRLSAAAITQLALSFGWEDSEPHSYQRVPSIRSLRERCAQRWRAESGRGGGSRAHLP